jgi:hypothetical protein
MQITTQAQPNSSVPTFQTAAFLLQCQADSELSRKLDAARIVLQPGTGHRQASDTRHIIRILKRQYHHRLSCGRCLVRQALDGTIQ